MNNLTKTTFTYISTKRTFNTIIMLLTMTVYIHTHHVTCTPTWKHTRASISPPSPTYINITIKELPILSKNLSPFESLFLLPPPDTHILCLVDAILSTWTMRLQVWQPNSSKSRMFENSWGGWGSYITISLFTRNLGFKYKHVCFELDSFCLGVTLRNQSQDS